MIFLDVSINLEYNNALIDKSDWTVEIDSVIGLIVEYSIIYMFLVEFSSSQFENIFRDDNLK